MKLLIIGSGAIVPHHIKAAQNTGFEVVGIATRNESVRSLSIASEFGIKVFPISETLVRDLQLDALVIATSPESLTDLLFSFSKHRVPTLVEKPLLLEQSAIHKLREIDSSHTIVGYNRRHYSSVARLREILNQSRILGSRWLISEQPSNFNGSDDSIMETLLTNTVHILDLIFFVFGRPVNYYMYALRREFKALQCDFVMTFENDLSINFTITFGIPIQTSVEFNTENSSILLKPLEQLHHYDNMEILNPTFDFPIRTYTPIETFPWRIADLDMRNKPGFCGQYSDLRKLALNRSDLLSARIDDAIFTFQVAEKISNLILS